MKSNLNPKTGKSFYKEFLFLVPEYKSKLFRLVTVGTTYGTVGLAVGMVQPYHMPFQLIGQGTGLDLAHGSKRTWRRGGRMCLIVTYCYGRGKLVKRKTANLFCLGKVVIIFPHCVSHLMGSTLEQRPVPVVQLLTPDILMGNTNMHHGGSGKKAQFICGYLLCDQRFNPLSGAILELLIVSTEKERILSQNPGLSVDILPIAPDSWLNSTINHLIHEVVEKNSGSATIITRLTELMFVEILRKFMDSLP